MKRFRSLKALILLGLGAGLALAPSGSLAAHALPALLTNGPAAAQTPGLLAPPSPAPGPLVVAPAAGTRMASRVAHWRVADASGRVVLRPARDLQSEGWILARVYRELPSRPESRIAATRIAMTLPLYRTESGDFELRPGPEGLAPGRYTIAVYDASMEYRWPLAEFRLDVR